MRRRGYLGGRCPDLGSSRRDRDPDPRACLAPERTTLDLIGEGLTNRQIADRMYVAEKTVKNYVSHLLAKLGMASRTQLAVFDTEIHQQQADSR